MRSPSLLNPPFRALLGAALAAAAPMPAAAPPELSAANLSPVVQVFGLPRVTGEPRDGAGVRADLRLDWASHAVSDRSGRAVVRFDGETRRYTLAVAGPAGAGWWGVELPLVSHTGGYLDGSIEAWHDALGLPAGDRPARPSDRLLFRVVDGDGREVLRRTRSAAGPGDAALTAGLPLFGARAPVAAGLRLEAPTGDPDRLLGSGGWDLAAWLAGDGRAGPAGAWSGHAAAGALYMTAGEVLPDRHRRWAGFARLAGGWRPLAPLTLRVQLDGHTPLYHSPLTPLGDPALELRAGAAVEPGRGYRLEAGFSEDLAVGAAPDITFHLGLTREWR